ncbi:putative manganese transporter [Gordonibacter massiliensis (ex Traore et al. 2017)]|uniref:putative manganese transporter n=1 Tax=Gordonibacter massiliensis (ex Traore et al. 2017) TaxID=1841863 RepID=UPI001C8BB62F|nr:putative manganese transporter [Gordonibacter massiliensis (ex Traore et al. 2017)]MBX9033354.1 arsenic efflux protein [Gordonibacter massiliensis (ex Traore et al. 2017)]
MEAFFDIAVDVLVDATKDTLYLIPFLFVTYLVMEWLEHKTGDKAEAAIQRAGAAGPFIGALVGVVPQCGFSAAAATLWAGRVITLGTLFAVFLSTSDEMLPIFIAEQVPLDVILKILGAKIIIGMVMGFVVDAALRVARRIDSPLHIHDLCEHDHCHCHDGEGGILKSAVKHTLQVTVFVFAITLVLNAVLAVVGEEALGEFLTANPALSVLGSALVGLVPNCAASVVIAQLYVDGILGSGAMLAGLLVSAGVGLLVLFRANRHPGQNVLVVVLLYATGVTWGFIVNALGIVF